MKATVPNLTLALDGSPSAGGTGESRRAFTMMELVVSIGILVIIILSVGVTFRGASQSVSVSNATMEMMASVRATQTAIEQDLSHIDKNGFLVIRCNMNDTTQGNRSWRFDQISFLAHGSFPNRTGCDAANPFTDSSVGNAAHIWWGHGVMEAANRPDVSYLSTASGGDGGQAKIPAGWAQRYPTGVLRGAGPGGTTLIKESECTLLRHETVLIPGKITNDAIFPTGNKVIAYSTIDIQANPIPMVTSTEGQAYITSSRFSVAATTPAQIMGLSASLYNPSTNRFPEADRFAYRFRALNSVYDTEIGSFVNGYFRTTPVVMSGVSSFKVEWSDGTTYPVNSYDNNGNSISGQLVWFGPTITHGVVTNSAFDGAMEQFNNFSNLPTSNDQYVATFSFYNKASWPKALRISMHVASERLSGGRDFVQVVNLPQ